MDWIIKIEDMPRLRIKAIYRPSTFEIVVNGEYKLGTGVWTTMCSKTNTANIKEIEILTDLLYCVYNMLIERVSKLDELEKTFNFIKEIKIEEED